MNARPDYRNAEIRSLPEGWDAVPVGNVSRAVNGFAFPLRYQGNKSGKYIFAKVSDTNLAGNEKYVTRTVNTVDDDDIRSLRASIYPPGTVIFPKIGMVINLNKKRILGKEGTFDNNIMGLIPHLDHVDTEFLYYYLLGRLDLRQFSNTTTLPSIRKSEIERYKISLPPVQEQKRIGSILSTVDDAIQKTNEIVAKTQQLKKGLMQQLLSRGIGHTKLKQTDMGEIPEEWEVVQLSDVLTICQYGLSVQLHERGRFPILRMNNFGDGLVIPSDLKYADINPELFDQFRLQKEDLLFNRTNSYDLVGKIGVFLLDGDYAFASYLIRLRVDSERADPLFINYYLNTEHSQNLLKNLATRGVSQTNINATNLKTISVSLPPLEEQRRIVSIISSTHDKVVKERQRTAELQKLKKGLMQVLLTGKVRVKVD
jgi:type I restriction enzyme S subunit